jgi:hypothetical protein
MGLESTVEKFRAAIRENPDATPGRYALFVSPELYVEYDSHMQKLSGGTVAFPLLFGSFSVVENMESPLGHVVLVKRREIAKIQRAQ